MSTIKLGIVEDEPLVLENLELFLNAQPNIDVVLTENSVESFLETFHSRLGINMVLLDISLPGMSGLEGIRFIKDKIPNVDIIMLTAYEDSERIFKALCAGAVS